MPVYHFNLEVPPGTPETAPVTLGFRLHTGIVKMVHLLCPEGCFGLVRMAVFEGEHRRYPQPGDAWYNGNGNPGLIFRSEHLPTLGASQWQIRAWSQDDTYYHTVYFTVGLTRAPTELAAAPTTWDKIKEKLGLD